MSINFNTAMNYSWMSQASYLNLSAVNNSDVNEFKDALKNSSLNPDKKFSATQATLFTNANTGYSLISQLPNTTNGTSATVFKSNADGSYTIAVRGTEPGEQLGTDLLQDIIGVVAAGKAKVQVIETFRYYKQLTTPAGQTVVYSTAEINALSALLLSGTTLTGGLENIAAAIAAFTAMTANDKGLGVPGETLIPPGATLNFTGHSLGGHVAYLLAGLVNATSGGAFSVGDVMTYNAPGENALLYELQNWFGIDTSSQAGAIGSKHLAFYGEGGLNVTAGLGQVIGTRVPLFIEADGVWDGNVKMENHSIVKLSDALAVYTLFAQLAPSLTLEKLSDLLKASSAQNSLTLESALDSLRALLLGKNAAKTPEGDREALYGNIDALQKDDAFKNLAAKSLSGQVKIESLISLTPDALLILAKTDANAIAYRYALKALDPFAVIGADYSIHNGHGELNLAKNGGDLTEQYLTDRALMLSGVIQANLDDSGNGKALTHIINAFDRAYYEDKASGITLTDVSELTGESTVTTTRYIFGGDDNDIIWGTDAVDHLYGGAGGDYLFGDMTATAKRELWRIAA